jgi:hypothetical protein
MNGYRMGLFEIETHFEQLLNMLQEANIATEGLFLNADAGFDSQKLRNLCKKKASKPTSLSTPATDLLGIGINTLTINFTAAAHRLSELSRAWTAAKPCWCAMSAPAETG